MFQDIDLKLVLYGEIFVLFVEEVLRLDKEKTKKALPFLGPKVRKFLCLSGTTLRARTSVAKFVEFLEENIK
jgi:hypothetical protein